MNVHSRIRQHRKERGLSERQVADVLGISVSSYCDLEAYEDEWLDLQLAQLRALASTLQLDISQFFGRGELSSATHEKETPIPIADALRASGKSIAELSYEINVEEPAIQRVLSDPRTFDEWPVSFVISFCEKLSIPVHTLL